LDLSRLSNPKYIYKHRDNILPALRRLVTSPLRAFRRRSALIGKPLCMNDVRIMEMKDQHKGNRCFIIGNGPSLRTGDLQRLWDRDEISFGFNKIYLAFKDTDFRPTYYVVEDPLVIKNIKKDIEKLDQFTKLFPYIFKHQLNNVSNAYYYYLNWRDFYPKRPLFTGNPFALYWGATVVYTAIQFAVYMGCNPIYLTGIDFFFKESKSRDPEKKHILISDGEKNHFHPDYRPAGEKWYIPRLGHQKKAFESAAIYSVSHGISIINASRASQLDIFERVDIDHIL
jgi:hypothetical protein